jgi:hypothetical protein
MTEPNANVNPTGGGTAGTPPSVPSVPAAVAPAPAPAPAPQNMVPQSAMDRVTAEKWEAIRGKEEAERQATIARATIEELRKMAAGEPARPPSAPAAPAPRVDPRMSAEELRKLVQEQSAVNDFNKACNEAVEKGRTAHTDFDKVVIQDLTKLSPIYDPQAGKPIIPQPLVEAALETGEAHEVLYALGKDAALAERIMRLSPIRQAVEVARLHSKMAAERKPEGDEKDEKDEDERAPENTSKAPPPIRSRVGAGSGGTRPAFDMNDTSKSNMRDWMAQREAQVAQARANGKRR